MEEFSFLCGRDWIFKQHLNELRLQRVDEERQSMGKGLADEH
jgi:hypothetical protein